MDFISEGLGDGRKFRALSEADHCGRECPVIAVDRSLLGERVVRELEQVAQVRGHPDVLVGDNVQHPLSRLVIAHARIAACR